MVFLSIGIDSFFIEQRHDVPPTMNDPCGDVVVARDRILNPKTIGQFTGLKDKAGVKIFEGDIVKTQDKYITKIAFGHSFDERGDLRSSLSFMRVGLREDPFKFKGQDILVYSCGTSIFYDLANLEVIGNIHQNPDLLG